MTSSDTSHTSRMNSMVRGAEQLANLLWGRWLWRDAFADQAAAMTIDMGDGRKLGAEDVLEGHYRRLYAPHRVSHSPKRSRHVQVQVGDNLLAAITVLAPSLAPLAEVAEEVARTVPSVRPEPYFRERLHEALERTHRQQAAQRTLGTRLAARPTPRPIWQRPAPIALTIAFLLALTATCSWLLWRAPQKTSAVAAS